jgi:preprotein translocase subunit SecY
MFRNIFNTFANCFKIPELKSRILFTLGCWRSLPVDGVHPSFRALNGTRWRNFHENSQSGGGLLGMYNTFAGGAL